jgi:hypothetical protein
MTRIINNSPIAPPALCYVNATQIRRPPSRPARKTLARYSVQLFITTRALLPQGDLLFGFAATAAPAVKREAEEDWGALISPSTVRHQQQGLRFSAQTCGVR